MTTAVYEHERRWTASAEREAPPREYRERVQEIANKGEHPTAEELRRIVQQTGVSGDTSLLRLKADIDVARRRRQAARDLARAAGLFRQAEALRSKVNELEAQAEQQRREPDGLLEAHEQASRSFGDAIRLRMRGIQVLHDTAAPHLREQYAAAIRNGELSREKRELQSRYNGAVEKELARLRTEIEEIEEVMGRLLGGRSVRNGELATWRERSRFSTRPEARQAEGQELDRRAPATILAELRTYFGKLKKQRAAVQQDAARIEQIDQELRRMREEAAKVERLIVQPANQAWSTL